MRVARCPYCGWKTDDVEYIRDEQVVRFWCTRCERWVEINIAPNRRDNDGVSGSRDNTHDTR